MNAMDSAEALRQRMPIGACDCHMHIYDQRFPARPHVVMRVGPVPVYREVCKSLGIGRMVVVQPVAYGFDNACTLDAMSQLGSAARGIVVIEPETSASELQRLHALGVRGVRHMMILPGGLGWDSMEAMAHSVGPLGWNLNLQFDGHQMPERLDFLKTLPVKLVIDHIGSFHDGVNQDDVGFRALLALLDTGRVWIKLSAPYSYRMSRCGPPHFEDIGRLARVLIAAYPERCLWASNWPHPTEAIPPDTADMLSLLHQWAPDVKARTRILVDNPCELYGFGETDVLPSTDA
jgi:D-galactarolactone isomerase